VESGNDLKLIQSRLALAVELGGVGVYDHAVPIEEECHHSERCAQLLGYTVKELTPAINFLTWLAEQPNPVLSQ